MESKIKTPDELAKIVANFKKNGKKIVQCHGVFDLIHPGHLFHFEAAKKQGDILVVSITADKFVKKGPDFPIFSEAIRAKSLAALEVVDYVVIDYNCNAVEIIKKIKPDIYFKGQEYELALKDPKRNLYKEAMAVKSVGGEIKFSYEPVYSSTNLLKHRFNVYPQKTKEFLEKFSRKYQAQDLSNFLKNLEKLKVLLIGETIIDEYCYCKGMNKIPKDNLVGTKYLNNEIFAGGILACANHLAGFCKNVDLVSVLGKNLSIDIGKEIGVFIQNSLKPNIRCKFFYDKNGQIIVKRRFIEPTFFSKMFEVYYFDDQDLPKNVSDKINDYLAKVISNYDLVIVNDYGHGFFNEKIIKTLRKKSKFLAVSTQTNSANFGFNLITKYRSPDYICIDEPEARLAVCNNRGDIKSVIRQIFKATKTRKLMITRGHLGSIASENKGKIYETPVLSTTIIDRLGAGDAFFTISAGLAAQNCPMEVVSFIGNVAGAIQVATMGNKESINADQVYRFMKTLLK
ncbi:MAG: PfkB family carbohydrate kinase [Candidatus Paceibacterota bacterium]